MRGRDDDDVRDVLRALNDPLLLCNRLGLDARRVSGGFNVLCPWHDETNPSCNLRPGSRDGTIRVKCFACGNGGDALDLIRQSMNVDFGGALQIASEWAGVALSRSPRRDRASGLPAVVTPRGKPPGDAESPSAALSLDRVLEFHDALMNDAERLASVMSDRRISLAVIEAERLGWDARRSALVIPYVLDRVPRYLKLKLPRGSKPAYLREPKGQVDFPYGVDALTGSASVVVCEGELDALALRSLGVENVVSVPNGAASASGQATRVGWLDHLEPFRDIVICFDADEAGAKGAAALVERLGVERCRIVKLPPIADASAKDVTDYVRAEATEVLLRAVAAARGVDHPRVEQFGGRPIEEARIAAGFGPAGVLAGANIRTGIDEVDINIGGIRRNEVTMIYGAPGAGKSLFAQELLCRLLDAGEKCFVASLEMTRAQWINRMVLRASRQVVPAASLGSLQRPTISAEAYESVLARIDRGNLFFLDGDGDMDVTIVLEALDFARRRFGVTFAIVDHLQRLKPPPATERDWRANDELNSMLESFAHRSKVGLIIPSHVTLDRRGDKNPRPTLLDARGGAGAPQNAAVIVGLWRSNVATDEAVSQSSVCGLKLRDGVGRENRWVGLAFDTICQGFYSEGDESGRAPAVLGVRDEPEPEPEIDLDTDDAVVEVDVDEYVPEDF